MSSGTICSSGAPVIVTTTADNDGRGEHQRRDLRGIQRRYVHDEEAAVGDVGAAGLVEHPARVGDGGAVGERGELLAGDVDPAARERPPRATRDVHGRCGALNGYCRANDV